MQNIAFHVHSTGSPITRSVARSNPATQATRIAVTAI